MIVTVIDNNCVRRLYANRSGVVGHPVDGLTVTSAELLCCCSNCSTANSAKSSRFLAILGVCVLVIGYTLLGAFAFMALEGDLKSVSVSECLFIAWIIEQTLMCSHKSCAKKKRKKFYLKLFFYQVIYCLR